MVSQDSTLMTNLKASPPVLASAGVWGGRVRVIVDTFETIVAGGATSVDADGDFFRLCTLPSNARVLQFWAASDDLDSSSAVALNYGLYTADTATVLDEDMFASAINHQSAVVPTDINFEARPGDIAHWAMPLWERLNTAIGGSVTTDPGIHYDICATQNAAATTTLAATYSFMILYTID